MTGKPLSETSLLRSSAQALKWSWIQDSKNKHF